MGGVVQQINLYQVKDAAAASTAAARLLLLGGVAAFAIVVGMAVVGQMQLSSLQAERTAVAGELRRQEALKAQLEERVAGIGVDPFLEAELARLGEARRRLQDNLAAIRIHNSADTAGFSDYFVGLARNTLEGIWFNSLGLSAGGAELLLKGQAIEPALVPRLLQVLAAEPAFNGRTFRKVSFQRRDAEGQAVVDFELRSAQAAEMADAG